MTGGRAAVSGPKAFWKAASMKASTAGAEDVLAVCGHLPRPSRACFNFSTSASALSACSRSILTYTQTVQLLDSLSPCGGSTTTRSDPDNQLILSSQRDQDFIGCSSLCDCAPPWTAWTLPMGQPRDSGELGQDGNERIRERRGGLDVYLWADRGSSSIPTGHQVRVRRPLFQQTLSQELA
ncbi:hypothetical protein HNQ08_003627 [Deinococcus humi]|uniref:Uncharacterized protein n=1 Tax=Deinococcus humi TaxID=662880 RepID=A0A7W8NEM3_9DEIO|nr:hypothetical protein [Deinococcus humi]